MTKGTAPPLSMTFDQSTNRMTGVPHDANGNVLGTAGTAYDVENRTLTWDGAESYGYAPDNRRVWRRYVAAGVTFEDYTLRGLNGKPLGTCRLFWDDNEEQGPWVLRWALQSQQVWFGAKEVRPPTTQAMVHDRLGTATQGISHYPSGELKAGTQQGPDWATYPGDGTGLRYADQRYYHPGWGRFTTPDPYKASASTTNPQSWNRYPYVIGDPVSYHDPSGLDYTLPNVNQFNNSDPRNVATGDTSVTVSASHPGAVPVWMNSVGGPGGDFVSMELSNDGPLAFGDAGQLFNPCDYVPEGRSTTLTISTGLIGGPVFVVSTVQNYNTGEVSVFTAIGAGVGASGGALVTLTSGFLFGLGDSNANYSGGFTSITAGLGPFTGYGSVSSGGPTAPLSLSLDQVVEVGAGLGTTLVPLPFSLAGSATGYSTPMSLGNLLGAGAAFATPLDFALYGIRQLCR